jgi:hypothetical protein
MRSSSSDVKEKRYISKLKFKKIFDMNLRIIPLLLLPLMVSCKMNELYMNVTEPAPVTIPAYIKTVGVINRSVPTEETKVFNEIERVFTLESVDLDRDGALEAIRGLSEELMNNNRFSDIKSLKDIDFRTSSVTGFPAPLTWDIVSQICHENGTDALFSLEKYDTDTRVNYFANKTEIATPLGKVPGIEHHVEMVTNVKTGWRIYDPAGRNILDEFFAAESIVSSGQGINPLAAVKALTGRKEAVKEVSNKNGHEYAFRLLPFRIRVTREYFVKGTNNFKIAKRRAQVGQWDEAAELWKVETTNRKMKIAGRAAYNMAIINEINGNLEEALIWARKSWTDYSIKPGRDYVRILENRQYRNDVLNEQRNQ